MNIEQLDLEEPRPPEDDASGPVRINPLVWVVIALVAVVAGFLVIGRDGTPQPIPRNPATPSPSARPVVLPSVPAPGPNQREYLGIPLICAPVTDGRRTLSISFEVFNISPFPVRIDTVTGVLPEGGLRQRGPATRGGDCDQPGALPPGTPLPSAGIEVYTLTFALPRTCPARYPIQVRIGYRARGFDETSLSILATDLSIPDFDSCGPAEHREVPVVELRGGGNAPEWHH